MGGQSFWEASKRSELNEVQRGGLAMVQLDIARRGEETRGGGKQRRSKLCHLDPPQQQLSGVNVDERSHIGMQDRIVKPPMTERVVSNIATQRGHQHRLDSVLSIPTHHLIAQSKHTFLQAQRMHPSQPRYEIHDVMPSI